MPLTRIGMTDAEVVSIGVVWGVSRTYRLEDNLNNAPRAKRGWQMDMRKGEFDLEDGETCLSESTHSNPSL